MFAVLQGGFSRPCFEYVGLAYLCSLGRPCLPLFCVVMVGWERGGGGGLSPFVDWGSCHSLSTASAGSEEVDVCTKRWCAHAHQSFLDRRVRSAWLSGYITRELLARAL